MTRRQKMSVVGIVGALLCGGVIVLVLTAALTNLFYQRLAAPLPWLLMRVLDAVLGLSFYFLILTAIGTYFGSKRDATQMGFFTPIFEALGRIAKGDFSVRFGDEFENNSIMSELAKSVTHLAVELDQMETMRQEFISNVSHEIQSPLTSIRGFAQALQNDRLSPEERTHYLTIIETESTRLSRLADNLLKLASLEAESVKFEPKPYRLDKQLRNLILLAEPQWTSKALEMDASLEEVSVTADEDLLSQVWINLIDNSIKYTPPGGRISVQLRRRDDALEIRVADTGLGISAEDQAHIFERFYKADKSRERAKGGSGLGLAIAQRIVEMHNGRIGVESQVGAGTSFIVTLPAAQP